MSRCLCAILLLISVSLCPVLCQLTYVGNINVANPGLLNIYTHMSVTPEANYSILGAAYDSTSATDAAFMIETPGLSMDSNFTGVVPIYLSQAVHWPKEVKQVPDGSFIFPAVGFATGSTIPGETFGSIYVSDVTNFNSPITYNLYFPLNAEEYIYHSIIWKRANNGASMDLLTCRVYMAGDTVFSAQLVMMDHPTIADTTNSWALTVLTESACDSNMVETTLQSNGTSYSVIFATGFYTYRLVFFWTTDVNDQWDDRAMIKEKILDSNRQYYDVQIIDVNNDGRDDVVATVVAETGGSVEVWEIPDDFTNVAGYIRHVIASGFNARTGGSNGRSPGVIRAIPKYICNDFTSEVNANAKPFLILTGADDGRAYYLHAATEDPKDWTFNITTILDAGAGETISGVAVADIDGDDYPEVFISVHKRNAIDVFTFKPKQ